MCVPATTPRRYLVDELHFHVEPEESQLLREIFDQQNIRRSPTAVRQVPAALSAAPVKTGRFRHRLMGPWVAKHTEAQGTRIVDHDLLPYDAPVLLGQTRW